MVSASTLPRRSASTHDEYESNSCNWVPGSRFLTFCAGVEPETEHSFLPRFRSSSLVSESSALRTKSP
ncbi:Uncharacterised protein [Mycobacteroides abscessus subsp. abscessus]|nr:Uncharacterised protein [Mycobacteroides abscessus subsp. abscessus]